MEVSEQTMAKIAAMVTKALQAMPARKPEPMPARVTAVLPVYNAMRFLGMVLGRLELGHQSIPLRLFIGCTEPDTDHCMAWLAAAAADPSKWPGSAFAEFRYFGGFPHFGNRESNLAFMYHRMLRDVETKYVWFQDADVLTPQGIIPATIEMMEQDEELGFVGTLYDPMDSSHVRMGNSLMRTDVAKTIDWESKGNCVCRWLCEDELPRRGLKSEYVRDKLDAELRIARHLPLEE